MTYGYDISANRFKQSYFKGFVDISGDGIRMRNDMSINFFDSTNSTVPKFSIKSDSMRITGTQGDVYDISNTQLLYIKDLSNSAQQQLNDLQHRTAYIECDVSDNKTMLLLESTTHSIGVYANVIPATANMYDLGSITKPFHSLYVNQGTVHFVTSDGKDLAASLSYNTDTGSLDLSAGGYTTELNNTRYINGTLSTPLLSYGGNVGIGVSMPTSALDVSGGAIIAGSTLLNGPVTVGSGDVSMNGNLFIGGTSTFSGKLHFLNDASMLGNLYAQTLSTTDSSTRIATTAFVKNQAYATLASPTFTGNVVMPTTVINNSLLVFGNTMFYGNAVALTQFTNDNSTKLATTAFVKNQAYATLASPTFSGTASIPTASISQKLLVSGDSALSGNVSVSGNAIFTGRAIAVTAPTNDNSNTIATTAYVQNQGYATLVGANFTGSISTTTNVTVGGNTNLNGQVTVMGDISLNGNVFAPTLNITENSTKVATTAYVQNQGYATLLSPVLTGTPTAPTASLGSSTTQIATTEYVRNEVTSFINAIPAVYDAIQQLSGALSSTDASFATQLASEFSLKADINAPTFTGIVTIPELVITDSIVATGDVSLNNELFVAGNVIAGGQIYATTASLTDNSTQVATTAYVQGQAYAPLAGASFTGDIATTGNMIVGNTLNVSGQAVLNNGATILGQLSAQTVSISSDTSLSGNLTVVGQVNVPTPVTADNSTQVATTAYVQNQGYAQLSGAVFTGLVKTNAQFTANTDASFNGKLDIQGMTRINNKVAVSGDASLNSNLYVGGSINENGVFLINKYATLANPQFTGTVQGITKTMVGLGNADNTSDINKPISTATQNALNLKTDVYNPTIYGNLTVTNGLSTVVGNFITSSVANLLVANQAVVKGSLTVLSDVSMSGNVYANTLDITENSSRIATTAYVQNQNYAKQSGAIFTGAVAVHNSFSVVGDTSLGGNLFIQEDSYIQGNLQTQGATTLQNTTIQGVLTANNASIVGDLSMGGSMYAKTLPITENSSRVATTAFVQNQGYATLTSPNLTGTPTAPTAVTGTISTQIATTEYVRNEITSFVNSLPNTLDAINQLSAALSTTDASFASSLSLALSQKANIESPTFTGNVTLSQTTVSDTLFVSNNTTLNKNVYITGDLSLAGNLNITYQANTIPSAAIIGLPGRNGIFNNDISMNYRLYVGGDVSLNSNFYVGKNATFQGVAGFLSDASFTKNMNVLGNTTLNKLIVSTDTSLNANVSVGGKLYCASSIYENGNMLSSTYAPIQSPTFLGTATFGKIITTDVFTARTDATIQGKLNVSNDTAMNGNLSVGGSISENGTTLASKYATLANPTFTGTVSGITKSMVGLSEVNNTSDINKPISTAQQSAFDLKADIQSPIFTGIPQAPTATFGTNTSQIATTSFVQGEISNLVGGAPATLNTLQELASAINTDASFAATVASSIGLKAPINNPTFTGSVSLPTTTISQTLIVGQDTNLNANAIVGGNLSVGGYLTAQFPNQSIPSTAIDNIANQYGKFMFQTQRNDIVTFDDEFFETSISSGNVPFLETLYAYNSDLSLNGNLYIHGDGVSIFDTDMSCNRRLYVNGDIYESGLALSAKYAPLSAPTFTSDVTMPNLTLTRDASINGNLFVGGKMYENGVTLDSTYAPQSAPIFVGTVTILNDTSMNGKLYVGETIYENGSSLDSTYSKLASPIFTGIVTTTGDVSMNANLNIGGKTKLNMSLDVSGAIVAHDNLNICGIINQYTLSLEDGNKVSFDTASQISTLQSQVATLQGQLNNVLQILANHGLM